MGKIVQGCIKKRINTGVETWERVKRHPMFIITQFTLEVHHWWQYSRDSILLSWRNNHDQTRSTTGCRLAMISRIVFTLSSKWFNFAFNWLCSLLISRMSSPKFSMVTLVPCTWLCCCFNATNSFVDFTVFSLKVKFFVGFSSPSFPPLAWYT